MAASAALLCGEEYAGICPTDPFHHPVSFEEERLRCVYDREIKAKGIFRAFLMNRRNRVGLDEAFDLAFAEKIAALRGHDRLSADVAFLCALKQLKGNRKKAVRGANSADEILAALTETDENIYDYVLALIGKLREKLDEKIESAKRLRDRKRSEKLMEPDELGESFFDLIEKTVSERRAVLKIPGFFGTSDLKLSIHTVDGVWYAHDCGSAVGHLKKHLKSPDQLERVLKKVCHSRLIDQGRVLGNFTDGYRFFFYLQKLILIAHADLYYTRAEKQLYMKDKGEVYVPAVKAETMNADALFHLLRESISFSCDEDRGITASPKTRFSTFSTRPSFLIVTDRNGIAISDGRCGTVEGEIFEAFYWDHGDLSPYRSFFEAFCRRFGAEFADGGVCLTEKREKYFSALCRFFNLAVLLSEIGHDIALPKLRNRVKK